MKFITIIFMAGMMSFSMNTFAAEEEKEVPEFKKADIDGDKFVNEEEFAKVKAAANVEKDLAELDEDKDGKLSKSEYSALLEEECE